MNEKTTSTPASGTPPTYDYKCYQCGASVKGMASHVLHLENCPGWRGMSTCPYCAFSTGNEGTMHLHMASEHYQGEAAPPILRCPHCSFYCTDPVMMTGHQAVAHPLAGPPRTPLEEAVRKETICEEAQRLIGGGRREEYGPVDKSFKDVATMWSILLGHPVKPMQVALCMAALKLCRESFRPKHDSRLDAIGYLALADQLEGEP